MGPNARRRHGAVQPFPAATDVQPIGPPIKLEPLEYMRLRLALRDTVEAQKELGRATAASDACFQQLGVKYGFTLKGTTRYQLNDETQEVSIS